MHKTNICYFFIAQLNFNNICFVKTDISQNCQKLVENIPHFCYYIGMENKYLTINNIDDCKKHLSDLEDYFYILNIKIQDDNYDCLKYIVKHHSLYTCCRE